MCGLPLPTLYPSSGYPKEVKTSPPFLGQQCLKPFCIPSQQFYQPLAPQVLLRREAFVHLSITCVVGSVAQVPCRRRNWKWKWEAEGPCCSTLAGPGACLWPVRFPSICWLTGFPTFCLPPIPVNGLQLGEGTHHRARIQTITLLAGCHPLEGTGERGTKVTHLAK